MTDTLTLTKHHGLGNDFLVVFHPLHRATTTASPGSPAGRAIDAAGSAPTGS